MTQIRFGMTVAAFMVLVSFSVKAQVWQPTFQIGLAPESAALSRYVTLSRYLSRNLDYGAGDHGCYLKMSIFYFRVNARGEVDSLYSKGGLNEKTTAQITSNIMATKGKWNVPQNSQPSEKCWFIYPVVDPGRSRSCSEQQRISRNALIELLMTYAGAEPTSDKHGRVILPPNDFPQFTEK